MPLCYVQHSSGTAVCTLVAGAAASADELQRFLRKFRRCSALTHISPGLDQPRGHLRVSELGGESQRRSPPLVLEAHWNFPGYFRGVSGRFSGEPAGAENGANAVIDGQYGVRVCSSQRRAQGAEEPLWCPSSELERERGLGTTRMSKVALLSPCREPPRAIWPVNLVGMRECSASFKIFCLSAVQLSQWGNI